MTAPATPDAGKHRAALSLQSRVGRFTLLTAALAVLLTGVGGYLSTRASTVQSLDTILISASRQAEGALGPTPDQAAIDRYLATSSGFGVVVSAVLTADGQVSRSSGAAGIPVDERDRAVARDGVTPIARSVRTSDGALFRIRVVPIGQQTGRALLVGRSMAGTQQVLGTLSVSLLAFGVLAVSAAGLAARRFARAGIAPVRALTAEVEERAALEDLQPVAVVSDDEIGRLTVAFNHLLDVIKVSRTRQARFVADAGHELRTPLTSMRTNIELLAADTATPMLRSDDRMTIIRDVRAQLIEFSDLVSDLIGLTREDRSAADFDEVDLTAILEETLDRVSMRRSGLSWHVDLDPTYLVGDGDLLARAFANVLDNAMKYSPDGGTIVVTLHDGEIRISDEGRGVSAEERPFIFDRFFRSEASRATPGTGLGLSITESVVRQHGGTVAVSDASGGGALFVLRFPGATRRSRAQRASDGRPPVALGRAGV